jgi:hypothetical protein
MQMAFILESNDGKHGESSHQAGTSTGLKLRVIFRLRWLFGDFIFQNGAHDLYKNCCY